MMRHALTILAATQLLTGSATAVSPSANEAAAVMFGRVLESSAAHAYPEEYDSFVTTFKTAQRTEQEGDHDKAARLFSLALIKGKIILDSFPAATAVPTAAQQPLFQPLSSSGTIVPLEPPVPKEPSLATPAGKPANGGIADAGRVSARIVGGEGVYVVKRNESLKLVASRLGVRLRDLARMNRLKTDATVTAGQSLLYNNRRIVPKTIRNGIVVNIPDKNLYLFRNGRVAANYPVALGIAKKGESTIWRTPTGKFRIVDKKENPAWRIPPSIQKEMEENGEEVVEIVPPGPKNPLGKYALRTDLAGILIHSTTRPVSINSYSSHGCIRVMPEHMERLFKAVTIPAEGEIIYKPVKVEVTAKGKVFLEVNRDSYEKVADLSAEVKSVLKKYRAANLVSWQKVNLVLNEKSGIAEDVTLMAVPD